MAKSFHGLNKCLKLYEEWIVIGQDAEGSEHQLLMDLHELGGKILGCWCASGMCHGHVLLRMLRRFRDEHGKVKTTLPDRESIDVNCEGEQLLRPPNDENEDPENYPGSNGGGDGSGDA